MTCTTVAVSQTQSLAAIRNFVRASVSCIAYARGLCGDDSFEHRCFLGFPLKHIIPSSLEARTLSEWIEKGAFDALNRGFLREMSLCVYDPSCSTMLESYVFGFSFHHSGQEAVMVMDAQCGELRAWKACGRTASAASSTSAVKLRESNDSVPSSVHDLRDGTSRPHRRSKAEVQRMLADVLTRLVEVVESLPPLLEERVLTMRLTYDDAVVPAEYEPPFFRPASQNMMRLYEREQIYNVNLGHADTGHHTFAVRVRHPLLARVQQGWGGGGAHQTVGKSGAHARGRSVCDGIAAPMLAQGQQPLLGGAGAEVAAGEMSSSNGIDSSSQEHKHAKQTERLVCATSELPNNRGVCTTHAPHWLPESSSASTCRTTEGTTSVVHLAASTTSTRDPRAATRLPSNRGHRVVASHGTVCMHDAEESNAAGVDDHTEDEDAHMSAALPVHAHDSCHGKANDTLCCVGAKRAQEPSAQSRGTRRSVASAATISSYSSSSWLARGGGGGVLRARDVKAMRPVREIMEQRLRRVQDAQEESRPLCLVEVAAMLVVAFAFTNAPSAPHSRGQLTSLDLHRFIVEACPLDLSLAAATAVMRCLVRDSCLCCLREEAKVKVSVDAQSGHDVAMRCDDNTKSALQQISSHRKQRCVREIANRFVWIFTDNPPLFMLDGILAESQIIELVSHEHRSVLQALTESLRSGTPHKFEYLAR